MTRPASLTALDAENLSTINWCVYSHPGVGKTVLAGSHGAGMLILDSDHGTESAQAFGSKAHRVDGRDHQQIGEVYDFLANDEHPYTWLWWDSVTLFQNRALIDDIMPDVVAQNPRQEEFVPSQREYLINMNHLMRWIRLFVDLPINFGVSCHVMISEESDGTTLYMPSVQGKGMPSHLTGYMNVVSYYAIREEAKGKTRTTARKLLNQPSGKFYAKDRFNALGKVLTDPTVPMVEALIRKSPAGQGLIVPERRSGRPAPTLAKATTPAKKAPAKKAVARKSTTAQRS